MEGDLVEGLVIELRQDRKTPGTIRYGTKLDDRHSLTIYLPKGYFQQYAELPTMLEVTIKAIDGKLIV